MTSMQFRDYLTSKKIRINHAAKELGVATQTLQLWLSGQRIPRPALMRRIYRWSKGQVQPNDFYGLDKLEEISELPLFSDFGSRTETRTPVTPAGVRDRKAMGSGGHG